MNPAVIDQTFSVQYRHLYSTDFGGDLSVVIGEPNGLNCFVGDRSNFLLRCFADQNQGNDFFDQHCTFPLVLYGPTGTGKTALAMAILARIAESTNNKATNRAATDAAKPIFLSAQDFDRRYRLALESGSLSEFRENIFRSAGLAIDNLHQLDGKAAVQREIISLLTRNQNLPFICTMDSAPVGENGLCPQLSSRLSSGLVLPVDTPGPVARNRIIRELAIPLGIRFDDDAIELMVSQFDISVPKLIHLLSQISVSLNSSDDFDTGDLVDASTLEQLLLLDHANVDKIAALVLKKTAKEFHVKTSDLKSNSRKQSVVLARNVAVFLVRELTKSSFKQIGRYCGNRDHSTILYSYRKILSVVDEPSSNDEVSLKNSVLKLKHSLSELVSCIGTVS